MTALDGGPHGVTETSAAYSEAARRAREVAEQNHPARLLGVAQVAIETALSSTDIRVIHAQLRDALDRIKPEPTECPMCGSADPKTFRMVPCGFPCDDIANWHRRSAA